MAHHRLRLPARVGLSLLATTTAALAGGEIGPGAYCPLPEKGTVRKCLLPAQQAFGDFFAALDAEGSPAGLGTVEEAVARGPQEENAYLALSSLTYGYYRLAQQAAASDTTDPQLTARLTRWNDLLAHAYDASPEDTDYRAAVRRAAEELNDRAPVVLPCRDAEGEVSECNSTESLLRDWNAASERVGIRGALERLLERVWGGDSS